MTTRTRPPKPGPGYVWSEALWDWVPPGLGENVPQGQVEPPVEPEIDSNWWRGMASAAAEEEKKRTPEKPPIAPSNITVPPGMQYVGTNEFGAPEFMPLTEKLTPPPGTKLVGKNEFGGEEFLPETPLQPQKPLEPPKRKQDILFDIMKDVLPDMTVSYGMSPQQAADVAVNNLTSYMQEQPAQFIATIQEKGWNPNTEALLLGMGFTWEQLKEIFPSVFEDEDVKKARKLSVEVPEEFVDMLRTTDRAKAEDLLIRMGVTREQIDVILPPVAPVKLPTLSWLDKVNEIKNDPSKLVPFLSSGKEIVDLGRLLKIAIDYEAGRELSKEDYLSLKAYVDKAQQDTDWTYQIADILGQLPAFAGEFVATGGIFATGQKIAVKAGTEALKKLATKTGARILEGKLAQFGIKLAGVAAGGTLRTIPAGITRIPAATLEKQLQALTITGDEESVFTSAVKALGEQWVEIVSESTGGLFPSLSKVAKGALVKAGLIKAMQKANQGVDVSDIRKVVRALGYNGVFEEMLEERVADVGHGVLTAIGLGDQPFKLPSIQQLGIELAAFSVPGVGIKIAEGIPSAIEEARLRPERGSIGKVPEPSPESYKKGDRLLVTPQGETNPVLATVDTSYFSPFFNKMGYEITLDDGRKLTSGYTIQRLVEGTPSEKVVTAPITKPPSEKLLNLGTGSQESDVLLARYRKMKESGRSMTAMQEKGLAIYEAQAKADPSKWKVGDGVGWKVIRQTNRGFRIIEIDTESKLAKIRSVADTGLTVTGGNNDKISDQWVHVADLIRDNKYNAPVKVPPISSKSAVPKPTPKEAWQMTKEEYLKQHPIPEDMQGTMAGQKFAQKQISDHIDIIREAARENIIPPEVLKTYPDINLKFETAIRESKLPKPPEPIGKVPEPSAKPAIAVPEAKVTPEVTRLAPTKSAYVFEIQEGGRKVGDVIKTPVQTVAGEVATWRFVPTDETLAKKIGGASGFGTPEEALADYNAKIGIAIPKAKAVTPTAPAVEVPKAEAGMPEAKVTPEIPVTETKPTVAQPGALEPVAEEVPPVEPPKPPPPQSVVPPSIPEPTPEAPRDREIRRIITQSEEQVKQDAPKALTRLLLHIPGLRQILTFERPGLKMTGENQKVLTAMVAEQSARSDVSVGAMSSRLNLLKDIRKVFGDEALHGGKVNIDFFGTDEQAKNPITKTLKDIADNPELYRLTENQKGILSLMEVRNNQLLDWVTENYGAEIGKFVPKENGAFLPNVDISEDVIEYLGSETRAAATGRGKTRVWQTARERMAGKTPFTPELDVQKLIEGLDVFKASAAAGQTYRQTIGGLTRLEAMEKTHPALYEKMTALRKRLSSLQGSAGTIESNVHKAIFEFLNSPSEGTDLLTLHEQLDVKLKTGVRKGMDVEAIQDEIVKVRQEIADIRPAWEAANLKPYAFIKEGLFRYFPADQAKLIVESRKTTDNPFLKFVERWRGGAFSGDISPFAIQGHVGVLANPFGSLKAGAGAIQSAVEHHDLLRSVSIEALADDIANNPKEWGEFASLMGRTLSGTPQEYAAGFFSKLPGFDKFTESTYITVTRGSFNLWQQTYKRLVKSGLSELEAKVAAAKVTGEVFPLVNTSLLGQSQARHAFLRTIPTSYSFIRQPATLITDATRAFAKVATFQKLTQGESLAARTIFTMAVTTLIVSATSAAIEAIRNGGDDDDIRKAIWDAINPDPYNGNFASLIIAGKRIPLGGPYRAIFRAIYPQEVKGVPFPVPFYGLLHPNERTGMPEGFMWNRISPAIKTQLELIANKDYFGGQIVKGSFPEKILRALEYEFESALPLSIGEAAEAARLGERYKEDVWQQVISQFMGVNMVTLDNTFIDRQIRQLGLPDPNAEAKPFSVQKPKVFDVKDLWSDVSRVLSARTKEEGYDDKPITKAIIEARKIKAEVDVLPNVKAISINADLTRGDTFIQFYDQWQERQKITDKEALKEFDKKYPKAEQGNMTQRTFTLLREYHSLADKKAQKQFLKDHPELDQNPRLEWLKSHPKENAQLAVLGQADVLSQASYDEAQRLIKTLGIPDSAVEEFLPPKEVAKASFEYEDAVDKFTAGGPQARLIRAQNPKLDEFKRKTNLDLKPIDEDVKYLELKVKNYDLQKELDSFSDKDSPSFKDDVKKDANGLTERDRAAMQFKARNKDWDDDQAKIKARSVGTRDKPTPDETVDKWVDKGRVARESKGYDAEEKVWYLDNKDIHKWALDNGLTDDDGSKWNEPVLRIEVKPENRKIQNTLEDYKDTLPSIPNKADPAYKTGREYMTDQLMDTKEGIAYREDKDRVYAYEHNGTDFVETLVKYGRVAREFSGGSSEAKWFRFNDDKFNFWGSDKSFEGGQKWEPLDVSKAPVWKIDVQWREKDTEYEAIKNPDDGEQTRLRANFLAKPENKAYRLDRYRRKGYELGISDQAQVGDLPGDKTPMEHWVDYKELPGAGYYYQKRYLLENPKFLKHLNAARKLEGETELKPDPTEVPAVRYDIITEQYRDLFKQYEESDAKGKRNILAGNKDFANARMERDAYKLLIGSERYVPNYMEYYKIVNADTFGDNYEDDWYLMEHPDFYNTMRSKLGWRPRDFNKVPSREVWSAYQVYSRLTTTLDRYRMRASNSGLDNWLYLTGRVSEKIDTLKDYEQVRARGGPSEVAAYKRYLGEEKLSSSQKKFKESSAEIDTLLESLKKKLVGVK